jgi:hypothetical protein
MVVIVVIGVAQHPSAPPKPERPERDIPVGIPEVHVTPWRAQGLTDRDQLPLPAPEREGGREVERERAASVKVSVDCF